MIMTSKGGWGVVWGNFQRIKFHNHLKFVLKELEKDVKCLMLFSFYN